MNPVIAVALGCWLNVEPLSAHILISLACVVPAVVLVAFSKR